MIQDAKNPIQFGEKLTREFADPTIFLNLQPSLYAISCCSTRTSQGVGS